MKTLYIMLIKIFIPVLIFSLLFFILIIQLLDVSVNLWRYLAHEARLHQILMIALLYLPKCISYSLPAAVLFTISFTMGNFYKNNELIAIIGSGMSLYRFIIPFIVMGILLSIAGFFFEDSVVINTLKKKNDLYRIVVHQRVTFSNSNVTILSGDAQTVYQVDYYNDKKQTITNVVIVVRDAQGQLESRIDADWGEWNETNWILHNCCVYRWNQGVLIDQNMAVYDSLLISEPPSTFRKISRNIEEMKVADAKIWISGLKKAGLPYRLALTEYYKKYFFALSPFVVALIAAGVGGRYKRNILLMTLLISLVISVVYYVMQMIALILAKSGYIPPLAGAGSSFILFFVSGIFLLRIART